MKVYITNISAVTQGKIQSVANIKNFFAITDGAVNRAEKIPIIMSFNL